MTANKVAARILWNAGHYLELTPRTPAEVLAIGEAVVIIARAYNQVLKESRSAHITRLGEPHVSRQQSF